jgi:RNA polymerase sigma-70 factor (sigma-E family)
VSVEFEEYVATRSRALLRSAVLMTGDRRQAEDLLQSALLKTWRSWPRVQRADDPDAYVRRILLNDYLKGRDRKWHGETPSPLDDQPLDDRWLGSVEDRAVLSDALAQLPPGQRAVLVLRYFDDLTEGQTANALECSVGTVKSQSHRALARLRELLALEAPGRL